MGVPMFRAQVPVSGAGFTRQLVTQGKKEVANGDPTASRTIDRAQAAADAGQITETQRKEIERKVIESPAEALLSSMTREERKSFAKSGHMTKSEREAWEDDYDPDTGAKIRTGRSRKSRSSGFDLVPANFRIDTKL